MNLKLAILLIVPSLALSSSMHGEGENTASPAPNVPAPGASPIYDGRAAPAPASAPAVTDTESAIYHGRTESTQSESIAGNETDLGDTTTIIVSLLLALVIVAALWLVLMYRNKSIKGEGKRA